jgi:hypothetical protein
VLQAEFFYSTKGDNKQDLIPGLYRVPAMVAQFLYFDIEIP